MADEAQAGIAPPELPVTPDDLDQVATTPEEWRRLIDQLKGTQGAQQVLGRNKPGTGPQATVPQGGFYRDPTTGLPALDINKMPPEQQMAPGEPPPGYSAMTPEGDESGGLLNTLAQAATPANRRAILRGTLGTAGTFAGAPFGPEGAVIGMLAGDYAGQRIAGALDSIYKSDAPDAAKPSIAKQFLDDAKETARDTIVATYVGRALPIILQNSLHPSRLFNRFMKLPPNSAQYFREAKSIGVELGVGNLTGTQGLGGGALNAFSRLPFIGTNAKKASANQAKQLVAAYNELFGQVAPGNRTMAEISDQALAEGTRRFEAMATGLQAQFDHAAKVGEAAGAILDSTPLKKEALRVITEAQKQVGGAASVLPKQMRQILTTIQKFPEKIDTISANNIRTWLTNNNRAASNLFYPAIQNLDKAVDASFKSSRHPASELMQKFHRDFTDKISGLSEGMAKDFGTLKRTYSGTSQVAGTLNANKIGELVNAARTPRGVETLREKLGDEAVQTAAKMKLENAWEAAQGLKDINSLGMFPGKQLEFSMERFEKALGDKATMEAMLRGTNVDVRDVMKLAQTAHFVANAALGDASTFVMRASVLRGGMGGLSQGLKHAFALAVYGAGGLSGSSGLISAIVARTLANVALGKLMQPKMVEQLTTAANTNLNTQVRIAALYHLFETQPHIFVDQDGPTQ